MKFQIYVFTYILAIFLWNLVFLTFSPFDNLAFFKRLMAKFALFRDLTTLMLIEAFP